MRQHIAKRQLKMKECNNEEMKKHATRGNYSKMKYKIKQHFVLEIIPATRSNMSRE